MIHHLNQTYISSSQSSSLQGSLCFSNSCFSIDCSFLCKVIHHQTYILHPLSQKPSKNSTIQNCGLQEYMSLECSLCKQFDLNRSSLHLQLSSSIENSLSLSRGVAMPAMNNILSKWIPVSERSRSLALVYSGMYLGSITGLAFSPFLIIDTYFWMAISVLLLRLSWNCLVCYMIK